MNVTTETTTSITRTCMMINNVNDIGVGKEEAGLHCAQTVIMIMSVWVLVDACIFLI